MNGTKALFLAISGLTLIGINLPLPFIWAAAKDATSLSWVFISLGLICIDLALYLFVTLDRRKWLITFFGPILCGLASGISSIVYELTVMENHHWMYIYALIILIICSSAYAFLIKIIVFQILNQQDGWYRNILFKKIVRRTLYVLLLGLSTYNFCQSLILLEDLRGWVWATYACNFIYLNGYTLYIFAIPNPGLYFTGTDKFVTMVFLMLYTTVYGPFALLTFIEGIKSLPKAADYWTVIYFINNIIFVGLTIPNMFIAAIISVALCIYRRFRRRRNAAFGNGQSEPFVPMPEENIVEDRDQEPSGRSLHRIELDDLKIMECAICLNEFNKNDIVCTVSGCEHTFHENCLEAWRHQNHTCPMCRVRIK